jgi:hypothetical protein
MKTSSINISKFCTIIAIGGTLASSPAAEFSAEKTDKGVTIKIDGELFTNYIAADPETNKPYLWPVIGPTGKRMTRAFPMEDIEGEKQDHPHHRSLWFGQQEVNGFDTWHEPKSGKKHALGSTVHSKFKEVSAHGDSAVIITTNDYLDDEGNKLLEDERTFTFSVDEKSGARVIDVDITFTGIEKDGDPSTLGDAKDAGFSVRVAHPMCVDAGQGGRIVNSNGDTDKDAWAKRAQWVDFNGPVEENGETLGIAILNHPSSFRHPTPWHVRTYGLHTANAFGLQSLNISKDSGAVTLEPGETLTLRHRVIFHKGDEKTAQIAAAYETYATE